MLTREHHEGFLQESLLIALKKIKANMKYMDLHFAMDVPQSLDLGYARQAHKLGKQKGCLQVAPSTG